MSFDKLKNSVLKSNFWLGYNAAELTFKVNFEVITLLLLYCLDGNELSNENSSNSNGDRMVLPLISQLLKWKICSMGGLALFNWMLLHHNAYVLVKLWIQITFIKALNRFLSLCVTLWLSISVNFFIWILIDRLAHILGHRFNCNRTSGSI